MSVEPGTILLVRVLSAGGGEDDCHARVEVVVAGTGEVVAMLDASGDYCAPRFEVDARLGRDAQWSPGAQAVRELRAAVEPLLDAHRAFPRPSYPGSVTLTSDNPDDTAGTLRLLEAARLSAERILEGP